MKKIILSAALLVTGCADDGPYQGYNDSANQTRQAIDQEHYRMLEEMNQRAAAQQWEQQRQDYFQRQRDNYFNP